MLLPLVHFLLYVALIFTAFFNQLSISVLLLLFSLMLPLE
jgi:hypothetical protein